MQQDKALFHGAVRRLGAIALSCIVFSMRMLRWWPFASFLVVCLLFLFSLTQDSPAVSLN